MERMRSELLRKVWVLKRHYSITYWYCESNFTKQVKQKVLKQLIYALVGIIEF